MTILEMMKPVGEKPAAKKKSAATNKAKPVEIVTDNSMDELHCAAGNHKWQRAKQRGRKPLNCPMHQPEKVQTANVEKPSVKKPSRKINRANKSKTLFDQAQLALNNPRCSDSDQRAIKYIIGQMADGNRKESLDPLTERLTEITRRVNR